MSDAEADDTARTPEQPGRPPRDWLQLFINTLGVVGAILALISQARGGG